MQKIFFNSTIKVNPVNVLFPVNGFMHTLKNTHPPLHHPLSPYKVRVVMYIVFLK